MSQILRLLHNSEQASQRDASEFQFSHLSNRGQVVKIIIHEKMREGSQEGYINKSILNMHIN